MPTSTVHLGIFYMPQILRYGAHGFTSLPKEGVLRNFPPLKIRRLRPGLNPRTWVPEASTLTPRPPKPLNIDFIKWMYKCRVYLFKIKNRRLFVFYEAVPKCGCVSCLLLWPRVAAVFLIRYRGTFCPDPGKFIWTSVLSAMYTLSQTERFCCVTSYLTEKLSKLRSFDR
jgi:hypothetical protein